MPVPGAVLQLSLPIVISSLVTILYNLADTFFVGMLNNPVENAAVTLVYPVTLAFNAVNNLFGVGVSSAMSRNLGCKEYDQVRICSAFGFYGAFFSGLLFSLLCTVFRTPLLALLGTDAQTLDATMGYMNWTVCCGALPAILNVVQSYMVRSEGSTLLNNFTAPFGAAAIAAMGISQKLYMIPMQVSLGFSQGIMPLVSYTYASGNRARMKQAIVFAMRIIVVSMLVLTVGYCLGAPAMIRAFMDSEEIIGYGSRFLRVMSLGFVFLCTDFLAVGVFQALGMGRNALLFAICRKVVLEIPLLILLNHFYPLYGLPFAQLITEVVLACMGIVMLRRIFRMEKPH